MALNKLRRLNEHTPRTAGGVKYFTFVWLDNLHDSADNAFGGIKLPSLLSFIAGKLTEEIFINAPQDVTRFSATKMQIVLKNINHISETPLVELRSGVILGEYSLELLVLALKSLHRLIDNNADFSRKGRIDYLVPAGVCGNKEYAVAYIFVGILFKSFTLGYKFIIFGLKTVIYIFKEY